MTELDLRIKQHLLFNLYKTLQNVNYSDRMQLRDCPVGEGDGEISKGQERTLG